MSDKEIGDIYRGISSKKEQDTDKPKSISDAYKQVVEEATVSMTFDDGTSTEFDTSDARARELQDIARVSTTRNQMLVKVNGRWTGSRLDQKQLKDIYTTSKEMQDYGQIDNKITGLARKSTIFHQFEQIKGHDKIIGELRSFLYDSAKKTLIQKNGTEPTDNQIKAELSLILRKIQHGEFQKEFVDQLEMQGNEDGVVEYGTFDVWKAAADGSHNVFFAVEEHPDIVDLRPATDNKATRGAAGPGEALLSFIYGGVKPKGVGDILLDSGDGDTIELKKQKGRIGKDIKASSLKGLERLFHGKSGLSKATQTHFASEWNKMNPSSVLGRDDEMKYFADGTALPDSLYQAAGVNKSAQEPGINIWPKSYKAIFDTAIKSNENVKTDLVNLGIIKPGSNTLSIKNIPQTFLAGSFKMEKQPEVAQMTIREFLEQLSGVSFGKVINPDTMDLEITVKNPHMGKKAKEERVVVGRLNLDLPEDISAWDVIESMPGGNAMEKIVNLIGAWQLKHYLTHIQPFKWLLVFDVNGTASAITHQKIIETPLVELVPLFDRLQMFFGIRKDAGGFDISVRT